MENRIKHFLEQKTQCRGGRVAILAAGMLCVIGMFFSGEVCIASEEESSSIAIIGGADGPTSIFIAGKLGGDEETGTESVRFDFPELLAGTFLESYFTVLHEDATEILEVYEAEAQSIVEQVQKAEEAEVAAEEAEAAAEEAEVATEKVEVVAEESNVGTSTQNSSGGIYQWNSEVLNNLLSEGMYLYLTEDAKEKMISNRYLLRAFQLAAEQEADLSVDEYEMTVDYQEDEKVRYEYQITVRLGEEEFCEAEGYVRLIADEETGWKIDEFAVQFAEVQE